MNNLLNIYHVFLVCVDCSRIHEYLLLELLQYYIC